MNTIRANITVIVGCGRGRAPRVAHARSNERVTLRAARVARMMERGVRVRRVIVEVAGQEMHFSGREFVRYAARSAG